MISKTLSRYDFKNSILIGLVIISTSWLLSKIIIRGVYESLYAISFLFLLYILIRASWETFVLVFIIVFPMAPIFPVQAVLIPGLDIQEIVAVLLVIKYFLSFEKIKFNIQENQKIAIILSFFFLVIFFNTFLIKHHLLWQVGWTPVSKLIIRIAKNVLYFVCIALIISKANKFKTYISIKRGLIIGLFVLSISVFLSRIFAEIGLRIQMNDAIDFFRLDIMRARAVGVFNGRSGFFAHYMCVGFGYFLSLIEKEKKFLFFLGIWITFASVLITASRAGFITMIFIFLLYMLKNIVKKRVIVIPIMLIMFVLFTFIGGYLAERMNLAEEQFSEGRGKFQLFYLNEIYERPHLLLFGMITKSKLGFWRVPHNQYLGMLYIGGLLYLLFFLILLAQIYRRRSIRKESKHSISIIYPFFGFILPYAADPNGLVVYFPIILAISAGFIDKANIKNRDKTFLSDYKENSKF